MQSLLMEELEQPLTGVDSLCGAKCVFIEKIR
jgi:hypothetical protein